MDHYKHFTLIERESLLFLLGQGKKISEIAKIMKRDRSTIYRELKRNTKKKDDYIPIKAQQQYEKRRKKCRKHKLLEDPALYAWVKDRFLNHHWSPEQISGRLSLEGSAYSISYNTIYRAIYAGMFDTPEQRRSTGNHGMKRRLRHKGKPRKRKDSTENRGKLVVDHLIDARPEAANQRLRFGDWEADTVIGKRGSACLVTLVDRKSRYLRCMKVSACRSDLVADAIIAMLQGFPCETITPDNGKEFSQFKRITEKLNGAPLFFAHPHCPWERGTNENTNGLLREYFPKHFDLANVSDETIRFVERELNTRPRKCLGFHSPDESFLK